MNKEEVKAALLRQIRNPDAPLRLVLLNDNWMAQRLPPGKYLPSKQFFCSEFKFEFLVESTEVEGNFSVRFADADQSKTYWQQCVNDISDVAGLEATQFVKEEMDIEDDKITFRYLSKRLTIDKDFEFRYIPEVEPIEREVVLITTKGFVEPNAVRIFLEEAEQFVRHSDCYWIEYHLTEEDIEKLSKINLPEGTSEAKRKEILRCFTADKRDLMDSKLMTILDGLTHISH